MRFTFVNNGESGGTGVLLSGAGGVPGEGEGAGEGPKFKLGYSPFKL